MRIISLSPNITDILIELGLKESIIATTSYCSFKKNTIGGWTTLDYEKIKELNADYVISCIYKPKEELENMLFFDVRKLEDIYKLIFELGIIFNREERAISMIEEMKKNFKEIEMRSKNRKKLRVYFEEYPFFASGNWIPKIAEICNAETLLKEGERSRKISLGEVENFDPDIIIMHYCGFKKPSINHILKRKEWSHLRAVEEKNIFTIKDDYLNKPSPTLVKGAFEVEEILKNF